MRHGHYHRRSAPAVRFVFWDSKGILLTEFMAQWRQRFIVKRWISFGGWSKKRRGMLTKGVVLLHDARSHTAARTIGRFSTNLLTVRTWHRAITISSSRGRSGWLPSAYTPTKSSWKASTSGCITWRRCSLTRTAKTSVAVQHVPKCGWQLCAEVVQLCVCNCSI